MANKAQVANTGKYIFFITISVENSVDPDKMASEKKPADQDLVFSKMKSTGQGSILVSAGQG